MESSIVVPEELELFLEVENCSDFPVSRYFRTKCQDEIFEAIARAKKLSTEFSKMGLKYANTTLLYGPSGTGKTTFARYVAYKLGLDFAYLSFANIVGGIMGDTAKNVSKVFRFMEGQKCVFMLDELDCIAVDRTKESGTTGGELSRITITLMQELDRLRKNNSDIVLIAATNVLRNVDNAMRTRFSVKREIEGLSNSEKCAFIKMYLDNIEADIDYDEAQIKRYVASAPTAEQRTMEADMMQSLATWIENGKKDYELVHIEEED